MTKQLFTTIILFVLGIQGFAQGNKEGHIISLTANIGNRQFADAVSWSHYYSIGKNKRFKVGYGLRLTNYFSSEQPYITAPAKFTSGSQSIVALFSENIEKNLDTVIFTKTQVNFLNAGIYLAYTLPFFKDKLDLGINIDAIGFSVGMKQGGTFTSSSRNAAVTAKPTTFNLLLISDSDIGSLNSEWYVRYWFTKKWAVKAGYEFLFTEYKTATPIQKLPDSTNTNDRFRNKSQMLLIGIAYAPFRQ